jgi:hypothetical protein
MAQWQGQYSGHTHATKIADAESLLRAAVAKYNAITDEEMRRKKAKAIRGLAKRVLVARRHPLRDKTESDAALGRRGRARLELEQLEAGGVRAILEEFGYREAAEL